MKSPRLHHAKTALVVAWLLAAWLVATNHCALGLMRPSSQTHCAGCQPVKETGKAMDGATGMHAPPAASMLTAAKPLFAAPVTLLDFSRALEALAARAYPVAMIEEGSPPGVSFAELVLQGSLLTHAPPRAV